MAGEPLLPASALALAEHALGVPLCALRPTTGGSSHYSAAALLGAQPVVVKAADGPQQRADLRHEASVLRSLVGSGLAVPALLALGDAGGWTVAVLAALPGASGIGLYTPGREPELAAAVQQLGQTLAQLHALPVPPDRAPPLGNRLLKAAGNGTTTTQRPEGAQRPELTDQGDLASQSGSQSAQSADETALAARLRAHTGGPLVADPALDAAIRRASAAAAEIGWRGLCLVHTDAGLHNVLWDGRLSALLDWEWAGVGSPLLDLAWTRWTLRWRRVPQLWPTLLAGYGLSAADLEEPQLDTVALALIGLILARVRTKPEAHAEWERRARWTIA